jgi:hypothetical protein
MAGKFAFIWQDTMSVLQDEVFTKSTIRAIVEAK